MILWILISGILVGLTSGIAFGPSGAYCIKKSLSNEKYGGYFAGLGAAVADGIFALVASFGITIISDFLVANESFIQSLGGIFLIAVGLKEFGSKIHLNENGSESGKKDFFTGLSIALASPFVIFSFLALYAILGLGIIAENYTLSFILSASTFFGAVVAMTLLNWIVSSYKNKIRQQTIDTINRVIGIIIFGTGSYLLIRGLFF